MWWRGKVQPKRSIHDQLIEARNDVRRQISVLEAGPSSIGTAVGDFTDNSEVLADLRNTLREIEVELTKSGPHDA